MSQSRTKVVKRLAAAQNDQRPVKIVRESVDFSPTYGFVAALTDGWVVVNELADGVYLDGLVFIRLDLVSHVRFDKASEYVRRALKGLGDSRDEFACAPDTTLQDLIRMASQQAELLAVRMENWDHEPMFVGKVRRVGKKKLDLQFVASDGLWDDDSDRWKLKDVTRFEIGGRYLEALERFGDPTPPPPPCPVHGSAHDSKKSEPAP